MLYKKYNHIVVFCWFLIDDEYNHSNFPEDWLEINAQNKCVNLVQWLND